MSRTFKETYTAFQRHILEEFMTDEELEEMDKQYNEAKLKRMSRLHSSESERNRKYFSNEHRDVLRDYFYVHVSKDEELFETWLHSRSEEVMRGIVSAYLD